MSPKQTALVRTAVIVGAGVAIAVATTLTIMFLTVAELALLFCVIAFLFAIKVVYDIELSRATLLETLNKK